MPTISASTSGSIRAIDAQARPGEPQPHLHPDQRVRRPLQRCGTRTCPSQPLSAQTPRPPRSGPSRDAVGNRTTAASQQPATSETATKTRSGASAGVRRGQRPAPVRGVEDDRGDQRHRQQHHQHAQVLHHRHHPVVGAEVVSHGHDAGRAAGDQRERPGHRGHVRRSAASSRPAAPRARASPTMTSPIGSTSWPIRSSADSCTSAPITTPMAPWASRNDQQRHPQLRRRGERVRHPADQRGEQHRRRQLQQREHHAQHQGHHRPPGRAPPAGSAPLPSPTGH